MALRYQGQGTAVQGKPTESSRHELLNRQVAIKTELDELADRRHELQGQRNQMSAEAGRGHDARIAVIDKRSAALESELFAVNDRLRSANAQLGGNPEADQSSFDTKFTTTEPDIRDAIRSATEDAVGEAFAISVFSLMGVWVLWRGFRRWIWKPEKQALTDSSAQIYQLQQSMDAMAIEIERISEAQRFAAKLLNDRVLSQDNAPRHERV